MTKSGISSPLDAGELGESKIVFLVSPIGKPGSPEHHAARLVRDYLVKKVFQAPEWRVVRADDESSPDSITTQVIERLVTADLIVADLTDHNPNVFYELAVAHGYERPIIQIMKDGQSIPFDVGDQRVIFYDLADPASVDAAKEALALSAQWLVDHPDERRSPLTAHGKFTAISSSVPAGGPNEAIADALNEMVVRMSRLERQQREVEVARARLSADRRGRVVSTPSSVKSVREPNAAELLTELELVESRLASLTSRLESIDNATDNRRIVGLRDEVIAEFDRLNQQRDYLNHRIASSGH